MNIREKFDVVIERVRNLIAQSKSLTGFRRSDENNALIILFADKVEAGDEDALNIGASVLVGLRFQMGAFIYFSITDQDDRLGFFNRQFASRKEERYDKDILDGFAKKIGELVRAVNEEGRGECFDLRVAAYKAAYDAMSTADAEQRRRDTHRQSVAITSRLARQASEAAAATERNRKRDADERRELVLKRKEIADDIRSLVA